MYMCEFLQDFGKIAFGVPLKSNPSPIDALAVVKRAIATFSFDDEEVGIQMAPITDCIPPLGDTDTLWFKDNILCILNNAAKFSPTLGGITVYLNYYETANELEVRVQDSGTVNLTARQLKRLFTRPQVCTDIDFNDVGGMGMGMYCLAQRVKALGGKCGASTRDDKLSGTIVWFRIPFRSNTSTTQRRNKSNSYFTTRTASGDECESRSSTKTTHIKRMVSVSKNMCESSDSQATNNVSVDGIRVTTESEASYSSTSSHLETLSGTQESFNIVSLDQLKVLVVDDAISILKIVSQMCRESGAIVTQAKNGQQAFDAFKDQQFDLVIMDVQV